MQRDGLAPRRHVPEIAFRIRGAEVGGWRDPAGVERKRSDRRFDGATRAEWMAVEPLRSTDGHAARVVAERQMDGLRLRRITQRRSRGVRVDVPDLLSADFS